MNFEDVLKELRNGGLVKYNDMIIKLSGTDFMSQNNDDSWSNCNSKLSSIDFLSSDWALYHEPRHMTFDYEIDSFTPIINVSESLLNGKYTITIKEKM